MGFLLKLFGGSVGPYIAGLSALAFASSLAFCSIQTIRLSHAKSDLETARADLKTERKAAAEALKVRDAAIRANADHDAAEATELADLFRTSCKGAFNAGYASRRCNDPGADAGGVLPDLRQAQSVGAFQASRPAGHVPAEPRR